jgi:hypothetical protein
MSIVLITEFPEGRVLSRKNAVRGRDFQEDFVQKLKKLQKETDFQSDIQ